MDRRFRCFELPGASVLTTRMSAFALMLATALPTPVRRLHPIRWVLMIVGAGRG